MLRERVEQFISTGVDPHELHVLLNECVADGTVEGLACVRRLYESDYGGITFNMELKAPRFGLHLADRKVRQSSFPLARQ